MPLIHPGRLLFRLQLVVPVTDKVVFATSKESPSQYWPRVASRILRKTEVRPEASPPVGGSAEVPSICVNAE